MMRGLWLPAARALAVDYAQTRATVNAALEARTATGSAAPADSATAANPAAGYEPAGLGPVPLFFLAGSVFAVSAGYGALMPLLPAWLLQHMPDASPAQIARHAGFLTGVYAAGLGLIHIRTCAGKGRILAVRQTGFLLQWPTLLTLLMFPVLLIMYARLAVAEESAMQQQFGTAYAQYAARTPRFIPSLTKPPRSA